MISKEEKIRVLTIEKFYARNGQSPKEIKQGKLIEHEKVREKHKVKLLKTIPQESSPSQSSSSQLR